MLLYLFGASTMVLSEAALEAVQDGDLPGVAAALAAGTDVNDNAIVDFLEETLLTLALKNDKGLGITSNREVVTFLLAQGADPNLDNGSGWRPIHSASDVPSLDALIAHGADIDGITGDQGDSAEYTGQTALSVRLIDAHFNFPNWRFQAIEEHNEHDIELMRAMIRHGASLSLGDIHGRTALDRARDLRGIGSSRSEEFVDLCEAVAAAGSWARYLREPIVQLRALRYLCLAGRATAPPNLVRCFGSPPIPNAGKARTRARRAATVSLPEELFMLVLQFWDCRARG